MPKAATFINLQPCTYAAITYRCLSRIDKSMRPEHLLIIFPLLSTPNEKESLNPSFPQGMKLVQTPKAPHAAAVGTLEFDHSGPKYCLHSLLWKPELLSAFRKWVSKAACLAGQKGIPFANTGHAMHACGC